MERRARRDLTAVDGEEERAAELGGGERRRLLGPVGFPREREAPIAARRRGSADGVQIEIEAEKLDAARTWWSQNGGL